MNLKVPDQSLLTRGLLLQGVLEQVHGHYNQFWVLGHAGRSLWEQVIHEGRDPVDTWSLGLATQYLEGHGVHDFEVIYPLTDEQPDLIGLGRLLGWHHDSPLGTGIHRTYGSWFAYRVVIAVKDVFEIPAIENTSSPCKMCIEKPCLGACPAGATGEPFDLTACGKERRAVRQCSLQCLARNVCPVGQAYRYDDEQMRYHYGLSLQAIRLVHSAD